MKRVILLFLGGGLIGFISSYALAGDLLLSGWSFDKIATPITWILSAITLILLLTIIVYYMQIKNKASLTLEGDAEDERDTWSYNKFADLSLASNAAITFALTAVGITFITEQAIALSIATLVIFIITISTSMISNSLLKVVYKGRPMPNTSDKDYTKKLLAAADEGERHVMLEGFAKSFTLMNTLLPVSIVVLVFYSEISGDSQLFAIILISILTIVFNMRYFLKIRQV